MTTPVTTRTVFIDTNVLVRLFGFWEACQIAKTPMSSVNSWKELRDALKVEGVTIIEKFTKKDFEDVANGLSNFTSLNQAKESCDFFTCQVSRSEMHHVILASKAEDSLIRQRVSKSLRSKRPLVLYRSVLDDSAYDQIHKQLKCFFDTLYEVHNINIQIIERIRHGPTTTSILEIAEAVWSHILTETMDAYIYAAAIECRADFFFTTDSALIQATNSLRSSSGEWADVARALREALIRLKVLDETEDFNFPQGVNHRHPFT